MFCKNCGNQLIDNAAFCPKCGNEVAITPPQKTTLTKKEFINNQMPEFNYTLAWISGLCYICAAINIFIFLTITRLAFVEVILVLCLTLGMQLGKSRGCAIGLLVVGIIAFSSYTATATLSLVGGVWAVVAFQKMNKNYKAFLSNDSSINIANLEKKKMKSRIICGAILLALGGVTILSLVKFAVQGDYQTGITAEPIRHFCFTICFIYGGLALLFAEKANCVKKQA